MSWCGHRWWCGWCLAVVVWVVLLAGGVRAAVRDEVAYAIKLWTVEERLPSSPLVGVVQSADGYLWLASRTHLIRFNGVEFLEVEVPAEARAATGELGGVFCGRSEGVWIFGGSGIAQYRGGEWQVWSAAELGKSVGRVLGLVETPDGVVRAYAERGLLEATADEDDVATQFEVRLCPVPPDDRATLGAVTGATADSEGHIWLTAWNGLLEYAEGRFDDQSMRLPDFLIEAADGVHAGRSGRLWIHGSNGVAYREGALWTPVGFPENAGMATAALEVSDGSLWIGNPTGLFRWYGGAWQRIAEQDAPGSLSVNQLIEDYEGTVWAACDGGLLRIRRKGVGGLHAEGTATAGTAYALWCSSERGTWVGYKGRAVRLTSDEGRLLQTVYLDADVPVSALLQDGRGRVWLGTLGAGLFVEQSGAPTQVVQRDYSLPMAHTIHALLEDERYGILVGASQGLMHVGESGELEQVEIEGVRLSEPVRALYRDAGGVLWLCCERTGVIRIKEWHEPLLLDRGAGLLGEPRSICRDREGRVWLGTTAGLMALEGEQVVAPWLELGLCNDAVVQIEEDNFGRLWLGTTRGLQSVYRSDLIAQLAAGDSSEIPLRVNHLGVTDGLAGERGMGGAGGGHSPERRSLWFPFENGVAVVQPEKLVAEVRQPVVELERVAVNGRVVFDNRYSVLDSGLRLAAGARNIVVNFAALAPGAPEGVRYRYRLEGARQGWSSIQSEGRAVFEWLPPGRYTLRASAEAGGVWNLEGSALEIELEAYYWQRPWFYVLLAGVLAGGVFLIARWMLWHRYQLQMAVLRREEALSQERARISRDIHDDLGNGLSVVATLSELAHSDVEKGLVHRRLDQIYDVAHELARNVDEIVWAVNPENDGWEPFISYFEQYTEYFLGNSGLRFHFNRPSDLVDVAIASKTRHHLLLAVREAVGNVLKHAQAQQVRIDVRIDNGVLEAEVEDDGVGFDMEQSVGVGHDGLCNMARRMREAGGEMQVESAPGEGTNITFRVPLE